MTMDEKRIARLFWLGWTECNYHLEWNDTVPQAVMDFRLQRCNL